MIGAIARRFPFPLKIYAVTLLIAGAIGFFAGVVANFFYAKKHPFADHYLYDNKSLPDEYHQEINSDLDIKPIFEDVLPIKERRGYQTPLMSRIDPSLMQIGNNLDYERDRTLWQIKPEAFKFDARGIFNYVRYYSDYLLHGPLYVPTHKILVSGGYDPICRVSQSSFDLDVICSSRASIGFTEPTYLYFEKHEVFSPYSGAIQERDYIYLLIYRYEK